MRNSRSDRGSVLLWTIGMLLLSLLALAVTVTAVRLVHAQRELQLAADTAALAAANRFDLGDFMETGDAAGLRLDPVSAVSVARAELADSRLKPALIYFIVVDQGVELAVALEWKLPVGLGLEPSVRLQARSTALLVPD